VRVSEKDGEYSLAEMARRDLDAALQLLVDRAQYITGASGAAIALRRAGKNDMQCRASTGSNAPELGALLSTEFGLSGESVRTRQPLRCDDAERDARVNREVCRHLGIASVIVMPVVNDEEVLGVFELFSGEVNAFGERDLSAVQRLSEMVETAVRLAEATENLPERLRTSDVSAPAATDANVEVEEDKILEGPDLETLGAPGLVSEKLRVEDLVLEDAVLDKPRPVLKVAPAASAEKKEVDSSVLEALTAFGESALPEPLHSKTLIPSTDSAQAPAQKKDESPVLRGTTATAPEVPKAVMAESVPTSPEARKAMIPGNVAAPPQLHQAVIPENVTTAVKAAPPRTEPVPAPAPESTPSKNQLFWSAALNPAADAGKPADVDQSHVPPVLRNLHKCQACGFPVSTGRVLCVECEEKKWRGQLKVPQGSAPRQGGIPAPAAAVEAAPKAEPRAFAAAAQSVAAGIPVPQRGSVTVVQTSSAGQRTESGPAEQRAIPPTPVASLPGKATASDLLVQTSAGRSPEFVLSAGLQPSQSWFSANKYVLIVLLVVGLATVAFFVLR
jgi:GAF domain-containing protein